ncbi:MAG: WYL domain-containing protein [Pseudohongiella sp.]|nr:WYL domain-containing protein [Pseudohongiella sp.]
MPQRPDSMETVHLTIEMLHRIPRHSKITAYELQTQLSAAGYERDLRSIQRHLKQVIEHFDIECDDRSKPFGYRWKEKAVGLSLPTMNQQESLLLALAEQQLRNLLPPKLMASMDAYFRQARNNLHHTGKTQLEKEWLSKVRVVSATQPLVPPGINSELFTRISHALYHNLWLKITYRNAAGKEIEARVMPLGLAQQGVLLYLVCRFDGYDNERSLALHRFIAAEAGTMTFTRPKEFDLSKYDDDGRFGFGEGQRVKLSFCIAKNAGYHLLEAKLSADQVVEEFQDHYRITATVVDSAVLDRWVMGFGGDVFKLNKESEQTVSTTWGSPG